ncbi:ABC transporter G family member 20-like [Ornithodoros turicata]|uniref:ABC transporter G family member 20-like n=1 Tax=Ornithodoros turicata TaxID=34597 RepID=UPI00313986BD
MLNKVGSRRLAIDVKDLWLWYGDGAKKVEIFKGININVPRGGIYALLGSSGCGKTTLLRCVLGRKRFQRGQIKVFGTAPGTPGSKIPGSNVGYMPQDVALFDAFSIDETLGFFGQIYEMPIQEWKSREEFLLQFFELPDKSRLVKYLSGGQKRRVSLAASMIHNPPLLVLDEPTVGIDPVLRRSIWNYLVTLTQVHKITVIITTHYIDEARLATVVGFLRNGVMLAESSPQDLMTTHKASNLEEVFLILAKMAPSDSPPQRHVRASLLHSVGRAFGGGEEGQGEETQYSFLASVSAHKKSAIFNVTRKDFDRSIARTRALFRKNVLKITRNPGLLLYSFLLPAIEIMLFCLVIGRVPFDMTISVVNEDSPPKYSLKFLEDTDAEVLPQVSYKELKPALDSVHSGLSYGVVHMTQNFSKALETRYQSGFYIDASTADESSIDLNLDMTNQQIYLTIIDQLQISAKKMVYDMFVQKKLSTAGLAGFVRIQEPLFGSRNASFTEFVAPGMILTITYIMAVGLSLNSLLGERKDGLLERCTVAGVLSYEVVLSHALSQMFVVVVQDLLLLFVGFVVFQLPSRGSIWIAILLTLSQGLCGMSLGLMISSLFESPATAAMLAAGLNYPSMLLSGILWPVEGIPIQMRWFCYILPQTIPSDSFRSVIYRGWSITHMSVWLGFVVTFVWIIVYLLATVIFFKQ